MVPTMGAPISLKNYLLKAQMVPFLKGNQLFHHVDGLSQKPPLILNNQPNPDFIKLELLNQLVLSTLNAPLSNSILAQVLDCDTSQQVQTTIQELFNAQSCAHVMHTQYQLRTLKKGPKSITEYYDKAKALAASLNAAEKVLTPFEFSVYLLASFGIDYDSHWQPISPQELNPFLHTSYIVFSSLTHESHLSHQISTLLSQNVLQANLITTKLFSPSQYNLRGRGGQNGRRGWGFGRSPQNSFSNHTDQQLMCQIYQKHGHSALTCYH